MVEFVQPGVLAQKQDGAAEIGAARQTVDPRDRVCRVSGRLERLHGGGEIGRSHAGLANPAALDPHEPERGAHNDAGEPHAADGLREQIGVLGPRAACEGAIRAHDVDPVDEGAEGAGLVVILAMHVGGDHAADGHMLGARRDGRKKPARQKALDHIAQRDAALRRQNACLRVEREHVPEAGHGDGGGWRERAVAIRAAEAARDPGPARQRRAQLLDVARARHGALGLRKTAPAGEFQDHFAHGRLAALDDVKTNRRSSSYFTR